MTDLDLVNCALVEIGEDTIVSLTNNINSKVISTAVRQLPRVKAAVLRANDWNCARRRRAFDLLADDKSLGEFAHSYRLPTDCVAFRRFVGICDDDRNRRYKVELDEQGKKVLLTDVPNAKGVYTHMLLDTNRFDPLLFDACSTRLAVEFVIAFPRDLKFQEMLWKKYQAKIEEAVGADEAEGGLETGYSQNALSIRNF